MPLIWKEGRKVEGSMAEYIARLRALAARMGKQFGIMSDETGLLEDYLTDAADEIERLARNCGEK